jgi:hypothetical protein
VHSLLDQKEKQRLFFRGGRILCDTGGRFILASDNKISLLAPVSFQQQVRARDCACVRVWLCTHVLALALSVALDLRDVDSGWRITIFALAFRGGGGGGGGQQTQRQNRTQAILG